MCWVLFMNVWKRLLRSPRKWRIVSIGHLPGLSEPNEIASKMDGALQKEIQFMQQSTKKTLDEFKAWCNKWMLWFFGAVGCAVLFLIMSIFMSVKASQANDRCDRLREERDSIQYRENVFKRFAAEHPEDFNRWLDKQK